MYLAMLAAAGCATLHATPAALLAAQHAVLDAPSDTATWIALGDAAMSAGHPDEAMTSWMHALSMQGGAELARQRIEALGPSRPLTPAERLVLDAPDDDEAWGDAGDERLALGDEAGAIRAWAQALSLDPGDNEWRNDLAQHGAQGLVADTIRARLATAPDDDELLGDLGDALNDGGDHDAACQAWMKALSLDPGDSEWQGHAAECGGQLPDSAAIPQGPEGDSDQERIASAMSRGVMLASQGDRAGALQAFRVAIEIQPGSDELADAVLMLGGGTRLELLQSLAQAHADDDELLGNLGDAYLDSGRLDDAIGAWERAAALDPDDQEWAQKLRVAKTGR